MVAKALVVTPPFCQPDRVFAAMFQSNGMRESTTGRVDIKDRIFFERLLHYIYSGQIAAPLSEEVAVRRGRHVRHRRLEGEVYPASSAVHRMDNSITLLTRANFYSAEELERAILDKVAVHGKEICQLED